MTIFPNMEAFKEIQTLWGEDKYDVLWCIKISSGDEMGLKRLYALDQGLLRLSGRKHFILALEEVDAWMGISSAGSHSLKHPNQVLLLPKEEAGVSKEWKLYLKTACGMQADLIVLPEGLPLNEEERFPEGFLENFFDSLQEACDLVVGMAPKGVWDEREQCFSVPVLEAFYGVRMRGVLGDAWGIRLELAEALEREMGFWAERLPDPGILFWSLTRAFLWQKRVRSFILPRGSRSGWSAQSISSWAKAVFQCIEQDRAYCWNTFHWLKVPEVMRGSLESPGFQRDGGGQSRFKNWEKRFAALELDPVLLQKLPQPWPVIFKALRSPQPCLVSEKNWADLQYWVLMNQEEEGAASTHCWDIWEAGWNALLFSWFAVRPLDHLEMTLGEMRQKIAEALEKSKQENVWRWKKQAEAKEEALVPMYYMEYVPGRPIVVPKRILGRQGQWVETEAIYRELRQYFEGRMQTFLDRAFGRSLKDSASVLRASMQSFAEQSEALLEELFPGDLHTEKGLQVFLQRIWELVCPASFLAVQESLLREMLVRFPPVNLMLALDVAAPEQLLKKMSVQEAVALADFLEDSSWSRMKLLWLKEHLRPDRFAWVSVTPMGLEEEWTNAGIRFGRVSRCDKVSGQIFVRRLARGKGGRYPRLRYFFEILYRVSQMQLHSELMLKCIEERRDLGQKFQHSLHWSRGEAGFSAAQMFEDQHHRRIGQMLREVARRVREDAPQAARKLYLMAYGYGVSQVLKDGSFLTCTLWSWAGDSFKGGSRVPNALTTSIEERWFRHAFVERLCRALGFSGEEFSRTVRRQMVSGRGNEDLMRLFVPNLQAEVEVLVQASTEEPAARLVRYEKNPLLRPVPEHAWENRYVLNPGALRIDERVYLFYRAVGEDGISRIGLAVTDGLHVIRRLPEPIFGPVLKEEKMGCEDPRVILMGQKIWMFYTAYDGNIAQIAAATIQKEDFLQENFAWKREGLAFRDIWDKDAILFPEKVQGQYVLYHRIEPSIWYTALPQLRFPCKERQAILLGPRPGQQWDSLKIGAGAQPLKTVFGWLLFYHGVDQNYVYRLGVLLVDLEDPQRVLYRSPNAVLEPVADYEVGKAGDWVPNVVFSCGAVSAEPKDILEEDDEVFVYYGAADSNIGVASARVRQLIPAKYREKRG